KAYAPNLEIRHLCYENMQALVNNYAESRAKRTAKDFLDKIKPAIAHAHATNLIEVDFSRSLHSTGYDTDERNVVLSFAEYKKLKTFVQTNYNELNTFIYVILQTGLRRGECLGLRPEYITENEIHVRESISPTAMDTSLKNKTAYRTIPIKEEVYNRLMSLPVNDDGYIFDKQFDQSKKLKKILRKLGITGTTIHGLRSTFASIIYILTKDELYTTKLMGHRDFSITKEYYLDIPDELNNKLDNNVKHFMSSLYPLFSFPFPYLHYIFIQHLNKHLLTDVFLLCTNECFAYMLILYLAQFVSKGIDIMGYITKRGASYLAQV